MSAGGPLRLFRGLLSLLPVFGVLVWTTGAKADARLYAGAAKVDITPPTGYYTDGYATNDRTVGTWTRLYARALVLKVGPRKVALVTLDLVSATGGLVKEATSLVKNLGFSEQNVLVSGTHTHSGTAEYANFGELDAAFPSEQELLKNPHKFTDFSLGGPPNPQVYTFLIHRLARALWLANHNLGPAAAGWSDQQLLGVTQNRSLEAHLANFGLRIANHRGRPSQDPGGYPDTIDPSLPVLRVDKLVVRHGHAERVPIGAWTDFANHGTDVEHTFVAYGGDHQAIAERLFEDAVRRAGQVPTGQAVVNAFADGAEGDMSSGLVHNGPVWAVRIGQLESQAMLRGWVAAGRHMTRHLSLDLRWTRVCFCGQRVTGGGAIDTKSVVGLPVFTGSEEGRGPLYDATHVSFEGRHLPTSVGPQGDKIPVVVDASHVDDPNAVPIQVVRIGDHLVAAVPGEPTVEMGRRMRAAIVSATRRSWLHTVAIVGLANEYVDYYTTPAEFDYQDYEGGHTVYGRWSGYFIRDQLSGLAHDLAVGQQAPAPYPFDPTRGEKPNGAPYSKGAASGHVVSQPAVAQRFAATSARIALWGNSGAMAATVDSYLKRHPAVVAFTLAHYISTHPDLAAQSVGDSKRGSPGTVRRLDRVVFSWRGGLRGFDRPLDRRFITIQRRTRNRRWTKVADDLGFQILWTVDSHGVYRAIWQVPFDAPAGQYRYVVTANRYTLTSRAFKAAPSHALAVRHLSAPPGLVSVALGYPPVALNSRLDTDLTGWPADADGGSVTFRIGARTVTVTEGSGDVFSVRARSGDRVAVLAAYDRYGNGISGRVRVQ